MEFILIWLEFLKGLDQLAKDERTCAEPSSHSIFDYMTNVWEFANVWISLVGLYADYRSIFPAKESQPTGTCQQLDHISAQLADLQASVRDISTKIQRSATKLSWSAQ
jgi:hypothetical protein